MEAAEAFAFRQIGARFILLFCRLALRSLYEHLGWSKISSPSKSREAPCSRLFRWSSV